VSGRARQARGSRRGLSQNIVRGLAVRPHELIVEIGAGGGRLTEPFARHARHVLRSRSTRAWRRSFTAASRSWRETRCRCPRGLDVYECAALSEASSGRSARVPHGNFL